MIRTTPREDFVQRPQPRSLPQSMGLREVLAIVATLWLCALPAAGQAPADSSTALKSATRAVLLRAARVLPMDGPALIPGEVLVEDGKITAVGRSLDAPPDAVVHEFPTGVLLPGFVELHCHVGVSSGGDINDTVLPHNMDMRTLDIVRRDTPELQLAVESGVTTALVIPGSGSTIGGLGTLLKTWGPRHENFDQRIIRYPGAMKIALHARGGNPARRAGDLGSTRLGLHWMLKVVLREAKDYHVAWSEFDAGRGDRPEQNLRLEPLRGLFRREFPVILHAYGTNDTMSAIRILVWELDVPVVISHGVYDSFLVRDTLAAVGVPMNLGPRQYEFHEGAFIGNAAQLHAAGVQVSICTDAPVVAQDQLPLQAAMAVRLGLPLEAALRGLTIQPAKAIGIADRVGSLTVGKDADLAVFLGDPLDPRHRPVFVMVDGVEVSLSGR